jgi:hypothetical protein
MNDQYTMAPRSLLRIDDQAGTTIHVACGELWVTQEGDTRDYYLTAGQSLTLTSRGTVLATAICRSRVNVTSPSRRESAPQRLVKALASLALPRAA